jgi:flagellar biogenesis protein FliO
MFRNAQCLFFVAAATAACIVQFGSAEGGAIANDSVSLPSVQKSQPSAGEELVGPPAPAADAAPRSGDGDTASGEAEPAAAPAMTPAPEEKETYVAPARESRTIGAPGSLLGGSGPKKDSSGAKGLLGSLDPRRNELVRVGGALAVVIGLMLIVRAAARRLGGPLAGGRRPSGVLEVLARYPVGRGQQVLLIKVVRRVIVIHQANATMTPLSELNDPEEVALLMARIEAGGGGRDGAAFDETLERYLAQASQSSGKGRSISARPASQTIDLTRNSRRGLRLFGRGKALA